MNAAAFLKLVEEHPLPWTFNCLGEPVGWMDPRREGDDWKYCLPFYSHPTDIDQDTLASDLADAAPAMAASILKLLPAWERFETATLSADVRTERYVELRYALDALRDSLPEELRD